MQLLVLENLKKENVDVYLEYLNSCKSSNWDTWNTTYKTYCNNFKLFLVWFQKSYKNKLLLSKETLLEMPTIAKYKGKYAQMTQGAIRNRIKKLGKILGIEDLYPHTLRKTAINLINNLAGLGLASSYANHSSSGVTSKHYIAKANPSEIRNSIINARKKLGIF